MKGLVVIKREEEKEKLLGVLKRAARSKSAIRFDSE
jgi:hypothetical protein